MIVAIRHLTQKLHLAILVAVVIFQLAKQAGAPAQAPARQ